EVDGPVAMVSLDRPESRNAQTPETWEALAHIGSALPETIGVLMVCVKCPSSSAGLDRAAFAPSPDSMLATIAAAPLTVADEMMPGFQQGFSLRGAPRCVSTRA